MIEKGKKVSIECTVTFENKVPVSSNKGGEPLVYKKGAMQILPVIEEAIDDMQIGEVRNIAVKPEDAYGLLHQEAIIAVNKNQIPEVSRKKGAIVHAKNCEGNAIQGIIIKIEDDDDKVIIDFNHPLAGKVLLFEIKLLNVE